MQKINVSFNWLASAKSHSRSALEKCARENLGTFFECVNDPLEARITVLKMTPGANREIIVKESPGIPTTNHPNAIGVKVWTEGTQALCGLFEVEGRSAEDVRKLIREGPYGKPAKVQEKSSAEIVSAEPLEHVPALEVPPAAEAEEEPTTVERAVIEQPPKLTPREKLIRAEISAEEVIRLEATLASIIYRELERRDEKKVPNTLQVSVKHITEAIMEHMRLPYNVAGNYRGTVGSFYSSRIALFALKYESSFDPDDQYTDWLFDCELVLDFIGGKDKLAALTREREVEVRERLEEEARREPPVTANEVAEAVLDGFLPDASIFKLAIRALEGRKLVEEEIALAEGNVKSFQDLVADLEHKLAVAEEDLEQANARLRAAKLKFEEYVIAPEILEKIREAKARIDKLAKDLGI